MKINNTATCNLMICISPDMTFIIDWELNIKNYCHPQLKLSGSPSSERWRASCVRTIFTALSWTASPAIKVAPPHLLGCLNMNLLVYTKPLYLLVSLSTFLYLFLHKVTFLTGVSLYISWSSLHIKSLFVHSLGMLTFSQRNSNNWEAYLSRCWCLEKNCPPYAKKISSVKVEWYQYTFKLKAEWKVSIVCSD